MFDTGSMQALFQKIKLIPCSQWPFATAGRGYANKQKKKKKGNTSPFCRMKYRQSMKRPLSPIVSGHNLLRVAKGCFCISVGSFEVE
jgi:hypothetical protein